MSEIVWHAPLNGGQQGRFLCSDGCLQEWAQEYARFENAGPVAKGKAAGAECLYCANCGRTVYHPQLCIVHPEKTGLHGCKAWEFQSTSAARIYANAVAMLRDMGGYDPTVSDGDWHFGIQNWDRGKDPAALAVERMSTVRVTESRVKKG